MNWGKGNEEKQVRKGRGKKGDWRRKKRKEKYAGERERGDWF